MPGAVVAAGLLLAAALAPRAAAAQEERIGLARGTLVRPVAVTDLDGRPADLAGIVGRRPVLVEFWATWCPNCAALEPRLRTAFERHRHRVAFIAIAVGVNQTPASVARHVARHALPVDRVLWDGNGAAVRAFAAPATSYVVVLDGAGKVVYTGLGPDQDLETALAGVAR